ncbi:EndoU domain-containing protein [Nocardia sp. NPDC051321]|uniref:EndoU domain-containing protein n=1 Tax=Nocardia sp. NPDC051321 TaxID=3364323 RepID=UPI0037BAF69F
MIDAVQRQIAPKSGVPQAQAIVDPQAFTDLDDRGNRIPKPDTVPNPVGPPPPTPADPELAKLPPAITSVDPSQKPTDPPYYSQGPGLVPAKPEPPRFSYVDPQTGEVKPMNLPESKPQPGVVQTPGGSAAVDNFDGTSWELKPVNPDSPDANLSRHLIYNGPDGKQKTYTANYGPDGKLRNIIDPGSGAYVDFGYQKGELVITGTGTLDPGRALATTDEVEQFFMLVVPPLKGARPVIQGGKGLYNLLKDDPQAPMVPPPVPRNRPDTNPPLTITPPYPDIPEIPHLPNTPDLPDIPGGTDIPGLPDKPEIPDIPDGSRIPDPGDNGGVPNPGAPTVVPVPVPAPGTKPPSELPGPTEFGPADPGNADGQGEFPGPSAPEIQGGEEQSGSRLPEATGPDNQGWPDDSLDEYEEREKKRLEREADEAWGARPEPERPPQRQPPPARYPNQWDGTSEGRKEFGTPDRIDPLTQSDLIHILRRDPNRPDQGGHGFGSNVPGKTVFPKSWGDPEDADKPSEQIIDAIEDIARNPDSVPRWQPDFQTWLVEGVRDGVRIHVIVDPRGHIVTAIPKDGPGVMQNDENGVPQPLR